MSKKFFLRLLSALAFLVAAVFYLLSELIPETFGGYNLSWAVAIIAGVNGIVFVLGGIFGGNTVLKKMKIFAGTVLLIICAVCVAFAIALPKNLILPIIAVVLCVGMVLGVLVTGGKKWDEGDNQKVGYKTYRERKEEEEKQSKDGE